ncbi:hypothetical protein GCM10010503_60740 [Streptomyces lucensis JCM 4490]|uniref:DUF4190 domain-containing protein n=1 Tax=Streptomyces lucensis JCM 4490 TaxID=1306176 RepID=A0A918JDC7_9ACTN|nr:DUF4190 domain-containing protein [Streptomyces lucensis]GGW75014.1 hypothetical protein GCM10010503_60740 [Streptomyces lucensis JCM 4490]
MSDEAPRPTPPEQTAGEGATSPRVSLDKQAEAPAADASAPVRDAIPGRGQDPDATWPAAPVRDAVPAAPRDAAPAPGSVHDQRTLVSPPAGPDASGHAAPAPWASPADTAAPPANPFAPAHAAQTDANPYAPPTPPATANPFAPPASQPPANPFAPPAASAGGPYAPPGAPPASAYAHPVTAPPAAAGHFAPPGPPAGGRTGGVEPVPPPPIAPDGPGQVPYGYPGAPAAYGYPGGPAAYGYPGGPHPAHPGPYPAAQGYGWPGMQPAPNDAMGTASLVLGILSAIGFMLWPVALVLGILAIIFGAIGRGKAHRGEATNPGVALAGLICGACGIVLVLGLFAFVIAFEL